MSVVSAAPPSTAVTSGGMLATRFCGLDLASPIVLLSGWMLLFGWYGGFRGAGIHVHVMNLTGLLMAGIYLSIALGPWKQMRAAMAAGDKPAAAAAVEQIRKLVLANLVLGVVTICIAGWGRFGG